MMRITVPQSSVHQRVLIEVTGPSAVMTMMVACDDIQVIERDFADDERLLRVTAQFIANTSELVGDEMVLKEAEEVEPEDEFEDEFDEDELEFPDDLEDEDETLVPESVPEPESELLPAPEPESDTVPQTEDEVLDEEPSDEE